MPKISKDVLAKRLKENIQRRKNAKTVRRLKTGCSTRSQEENPPGSTASGHERTAPSIGTKDQHSKTKDTQHPRGFEPLTF
ncbi:hypothetical protein NRI_0875 [Neorickettsia risticii str. Illinois]|uniref:Uncharacterized protein n=1 Tax=Neorickettsia risticii (strain Illinois) TaxID=434131 RepID=C6V623_NEORI|nr:hypothetical protein NRI_0875 [Neorickettsia risticii str. Illinois]